MTREELAKRLAPTGLQVRRSPATDTIGLHDGENLVFVGQLTPIKLSAFSDVETPDRRELRKLRQSIERLSWSTGLFFGVVATALFLNALSRVMQ